MEFTIKIEAPELVEAIKTLAVAISTKNLEAVTNIVEGEKTVEETPKKKNRAPKVEAASPTEPEPEAETPEEPESISLETVRAKLAELSKDGKAAQVKELISKFGCEKLTEIPESKYPDLMKAAEEL